MGSLDRSFSLVHFPFSSLLWICPTLYILSRRLFNLERQTRDTFSRFIVLMIIDNVGLKVSFSGRFFTGSTAAEIFPGVMRIAIRPFDNVAGIIPSGIIAGPASVFFWVTANFFSIQDQHCGLRAASTKRSQCSRNVKKI